MGNALSKLLGNLFRSRQSAMLLERSQSSAPARRLNSAAGAALEQLEVRRLFATIQLSATSYPVGEADGLVTITLTRSDGTGASTVDFATSNGTATAGTDYTANSGTLAFNNGDLTQTFDVLVSDDAIAEGAEAFSVTISNPTGIDTLGTPTTATVNITDNDVAPSTIQLSSATYTASETGGMATVTVTRTGTTGAASVGYATSNGTATAGADYTTTTGTINFANGEGSKTFDVPILTDATVESAETFAVTLSAPTNATLGSPAAGTVTITDASSIVQFSAANYAVSEGGGTRTVTVTRTGTTAAGTIDYTTSDGTATAGADYTTTSGTLSFAIGEGSKTFNVPILTDATLESSETINLALSNPTGGITVGTPGTATITVSDNNSGVQFAAGTATVNENAGTVTLNVTRTGDTSASATVSFTTSDGSATAGSDYTANTGTVTFAAGDASENVVISILNDTTPEAGETFTVTLSNPGGSATLGGVVASTVTIVDEDDAITFADTVFPVSESAGTATVTLTRIGDTSGAASAAYTLSDITAIAGEDYVTESGTVNFASGASTATISVDITDDGIVEGNETFLVTLSNPVGTVLANDPTARVRILDDDSALAFGDLRFNASEASGTGSVRITRTGDTTGSVSVTLTTSDGTATAGTDYVASSTNVVFAAGESSKTVAVSILDDTRSEGDETFNLTLSAPVGDAELGDLTAAEFDIIDNEPAVQFQTSVIPATEANGLTVTVSRTINFAGPLAVTVASTGGTATAGVDYLPVNETLVFQSNEVSRTFTIQVRPDFDDTEGTETIILSITSVSSPDVGVGQNGTAVVNLADFNRPAAVLSSRLVTSAAGVTGVTLGFSSSLLPPTATDLTNYDIYSYKEKQFGGSPSRKRIPIATAAYDVASRTVTLVTQKPLKENTMYEVVANTTRQTGLVDVNGDPIDGNLDAAGGDDFTGYVFRGKKASYFDADGDQVTLSMTKKGVFEFSRSILRDIEELRIVGGDSSSVLKGVVKPRKSSDGVVRIGTFTNLTGAGVNLPPAVFLFGPREQSFVGPSPTDDLLEI